MGSNSNHPIPAGGGSNFSTSELINLEVKGQPIATAVEALAGKVNLPTEHWYDLLGEAHARGFVVAGATKDALLTDFHGAINQAISKGTTLQQFRQQFDDIVARHGWEYKGGRNWRSQIIYNTNIQTAYQAGRYAELNDLAESGMAPYWEYRTKEDGRVRPQHQSWDGLLLPADDPWWDSHFPPNGWNCRCRVWPRTKGDLRRSGKTGPDQAPNDGTVPWTNPATGEVMAIPKGIDPGWAYNPGKASFGKKLSSEAMDNWRGSSDKWQPLTPGDWQASGRPALIPVDPPQAKLGPKAEGKEDLVSKITAAIGGEEKVFTVSAGEFSYPVLVNAETLADHINDMSRAEFAPYLPELMTDPFEVWMSFERHSASGKVVLRQRVIKAVDVEQDRGLLMVANSTNGIMEAWTFIPASNLKYLNKQRRGMLVWGREIRT